MTEDKFFVFIFFNYYDYYHIQIYLVFKNKQNNMEIYTRKI